MSARRTPTAPQDRVNDPRTANDLPPWLSPLSVGKGAIDCVAQRIYVWSMGQNDHFAEVWVGCPRPPDWSPGVAVVACSRGPNARAIAPDFQLEAGSARLPRPCNPTSAFGKVRSALSAFNAGSDEAFGKHFGRLLLLASAGSDFKTRSAIASFARERYRAGEGWTASALHAPKRIARPGSRRVAAYRLGILLTRPVTPLASATVKVVLDCGSGLIQRWVGPNAVA